MSLTIYAHNESDWLSELTAAIRYRLRRKPGLPQGLPDEISVVAAPESVGASDCVAIVLNRDFMDSWSETRFLEKLNERIETGVRVCLIETEPIDFQDRPEILRNLPAYRFWTETGGGCRTLGDPKPDERHPDYLPYYQAVNDFCSDLAANIRLKIKPVEKDPETRGLESAEPVSVFISHAPGDLEKAEQLYDELVSKGVKPWMESRDLKAGQSIRIVMRQAIKSSEYYLVLLSKQSIHRGVFNWQQKTALEILDNLPQADVFVVPVRLDDVDPADVNTRFHDIHTADLFEDYGRGLKNIFRTLGVTGGPEPSLEKPDIRPAVYLAEVSQGLFEQRTKVERYLEQQGYMVLPDHPLFHADPAVYRESVEKTLERCRMFVQLLDEKPLVMYPGQPCYAMLQHECAVKTGKTVMQWRHPDLEVKSVGDETRRTFLSGGTVHAFNLEDFKRQIIANLAQKKTEPSKPAPDESANPFVYLNVHHTDGEITEKIETVMKENGIDFAAPMSDEDEEYVAELHENLEISDGVVVVYGGADAKWVARQLRECIKYISRSGRRVIVTAVYDGPPQDKKPLRIHSSRIILINCKDCHRPEEFRPFFDALRKRRAS